MKKIINESTSQIKPSVEANPKGFWEKYKMIVGYMVAITLATIFLFCWPFDGIIFCISLLWGVSGIRLETSNVTITKTSVVIMWSIFYFGLCGILMQVLKTAESIMIGAFCASLVLMLLYRYTSIISYYLKYNKTKIGHTSAFFAETKYNGLVGSFLLLTLTLSIANGADSSTKTNKDEQKVVLQELTQETFVPVKKISEEIYDGKTIYILEAKGQRFQVSPFKYPDVRDINSNSQVKVIFGDDDYLSGLKKVKKLQFKN